MAKYSSTFTISHTVCWLCVAHMNKQAVSVLSCVHTNTFSLHSKSCALPHGRTAINYSTLCSLTSGCRYHCAALNSHTTALIWTHTLSVGSHVHMHTQTHTRKQRLRNMLKILTQCFSSRYKAVKPGLHISLKTMEVLGFVYFSLRWNGLNRFICTGRLKELTYSSTL